MPSDRKFIAAKVPKKTAQELEKLRKKIQAERPDTVVTTSDALRYAIHHSFSASFVTTPLNKSLEPEDDETKNGEEKGKAKGG